MNYSTYWSILDTPSKTIQSNSVCLYIAIGSGLLWFITKKLIQERDGGDKKIILWSIGSFAVLGLAGYVMLTFFYPDKSNERALEMLNSMTTPRVEGTVSNFEQTFRDGRETIEKFTVDSVQFAYGDAALGKFNSFSETNNNVISNGKNVRITYSHGSHYGSQYNSILKLELAER